jgi:hypothetical protein
MGASEVALIHVLASYMVFFVANINLILISKMSLKRMYDLIRS